MIGNEVNTNKVDIKLYIYIYIYIFPKICVGQTIMIQLQKKISYLIIKSFNKCNVIFNMILILL